VEGYTYDTFGKFQRYGNAVMNTYGFTGREYDAETGLYYYRARYYDPETGRFISKDPIGFAGGDANQYNYVLGDPVNWGDPWGLINWRAVGRGTLGVTGGVMSIGLSAAISSTGVGSVVGLPVALAGSASLGWGISQIIVGITDNEIPFNGTVEAIIQNATESGLLQDELLAVNTLTQMLIPGSPSTKLGNANDVLQNSYIIYSEALKSYKRCKK